MYQSICQLNDIPLNGGVAALVGNQQIAIFRVSLTDKEAVYALANYDPFSEANVLSRGIIGSIGDKTVVASPIYKQHFNLASGQCIEDDSVKLKTWQIKVESDEVFLLNEDAVAA